MEHLKSALLGWAPALPANVRLGCNGSPGLNMSLLRTYVNYDRKKFYKIGSILYALSIYIQTSLMWVGSWPCPQTLRYPGANVYKNTALIYHGKLPR